MEQEQLHILLIEDSPTYRALVCRMLREAKGCRFAVETAERLADGLARLKRDRFDAVLLDLTVPDSEGVDTFRRLHAEVNDVPVVVLTNVDDEAVAVATLNLGAADYLVKGEVNANWLVRSIRFAIERRRAEREGEAPPRLWPSPTAPTIAVQKRGDVAVIRFLERRPMHPDMLQDIRDRLVRLVEREHCRELVLDFSEVEYFPNAAMGMLLTVDRKVRSAAGRLRLRQMAPEVVEHFVARRLHEVFDIHERGGEAEEQA